MNEDYKRKRVEELLTEAREGSLSIKKFIDELMQLTEIIVGSEQPNNGSEPETFTIPRQPEGGHYYYLNFRRPTDLPAYHYEDCRDGIDTTLYESGNYFTSHEERNLVGNYLFAWLKLYHFARQCDWEGYMVRRSTENTMYCALYTIDFDLNNKVIPLAYYVGRLDQFGTILFPTEEELKKAWNSLTKGEQQAYINFHTNGNIKFGGIK